MYFTYARFVVALSLTARVAPIPRNVNYLTSGRRPPEAPVAAVELRQTVHRKSKLINRDQPIGCTSFSSEETNMLMFKGGALGAKNRWNNTKGTMRADESKRRVSQVGVIILDQPGKMYIPGTWYVLTEAVAECLSRPLDGGDSVNFYAKLSNIVTFLVNVWSDVFVLIYYITREQGIGCSQFSDWSMF